MTTTAQESPKSNHESLSLTIVTPTELINQTGNSLHLSYAPAGGSLPSSQNILLMPTIESITEPSINSTLPPPFAVDNSDTEEPPSTAETIIHPDSLHFTDDDDENESEETPKDDSNDFSFELNDFANNFNDESTPPAPAPAPPPPPMVTIRAPTSADVAYRALIKPRTGGRISQPVKKPSPLIKTLPARSSVPNLTSRVLRTSTRRASAANTTIDETNPSTSEAESLINETKTDEDCPPIELVEVVSLSEDEDMESNQNAGITLNLTGSKEIQSTSPTSAEEADRSASSSCSSYVSIQREVATPTDTKKPVLSREFTYNTPTTRSTRSSERRRSIFINPPRATQSLIPTIPEQLPPPPPPLPTTTMAEEEEDISIYSVPSSSNSILSPLSTNPTTISEAPAIILQKSLAGSASPSPNPTPTITIRPNDRLSSNLSPRRSMNPLHSSTPSIRNKSLQIVSIGEQEQLSTTVPQQLNISSAMNDVEMIDNEQQIDISIPIQHVADEGIQTSPEKAPIRIDMAVQTTPSLHAASRRSFQTIEQQTTPIAPRTSSCQTTPRVSERLSKQPSLPQQQQQQQEQITPLHSKAMIHLRRNVRFQFTPSTDARLAAKEKLEEEQRQQIPAQQEIQIITDNEREEDTEDEMKKTKKKVATSKKKKVIPAPAPVDDSSEELIESPTVRTTRNKSRKDTAETPATHTKKNRSGRKEKKVVEPEIVVVETKRTNRKRPNPKTSTTSPPETTSPTEPMPKRSKTLEVKQPVRGKFFVVENSIRKISCFLVPSPEPTSAKPHSETVERPPIPKKSKKTSSEQQSTDHPTTNKRKTPITAMKKGKRRLHSVEQDEGLNTADEEETIQTVVLPPPEERIPIELSSEEREKVGARTCLLLIDLNMDVSRLKDPRWPN